MRNPLKISHSLDTIGLVTMGAISFGYLLFKRSLAEVNVQFAFLDFPVFIGEIVLLLCLIIAAVKWAVERPKFNRWHIFLLGYFLFILYKAFTGYLHGGALAFRHAALFYYFVFAVFGFYFFNKQFFSPN